MRLILLSLVLVLIATSCKKSTTDNFLVTIDDCSNVIAHGQNELQICLDSIVEESRCPIDAICVWQGIARARFYFRINQTIHTVHLSTADLSPHYSNDTTVGGYNLKLVSLSPYPGTTDPPGAQVLIQP